MYIYIYNVFINTLYGGFKYVNIYIYIEREREREREIVMHFMQKTLTSRFGKVYLLMRLKIK